MVRRFLLLLFFVAYCFSLSAQVKGTLFFVDKNQRKVCFQSRRTLDTLQILSSYRNCLTELYRQGYIAARFDSLEYSQHQVVAYGVMGNKYCWADVKTDSITDIWLKRAGVHSNFKKGVIDVNTMVSTADKAIGWLENAGFPFAYVEFDSTKIFKDSVFTHLSINPGPFIKLDTLYILGGVKLSRKFIESYLEFGKHNAYNDLQLQGYDHKLANLPFIKVIKPTEVEFTPGKARVYTYLTNSRSSQFSGLVGFSSNPNQKPSFVLTGDVNLRLLNAFRRGETNSIQWQALPKGSQRLNILSEWDYLFGSQMGMMANFKLYRSDSTYINVNPQLNAKFIVSQSTFALGISYKISKSLVTNSRLGDYTAMLYNLSYAYGTRPALPFASKLFWIKFDLGIGQRIEKQVEPLPKSTVVAESSLDIVVYTPIHRKLVVLKHEFRASSLALLNSSMPLDGFYENEMYRIGGYNSIRGFNQDEITTPSFATGTAELQFRLGRTFNLYAFYDQGVAYTTKAIYPYGVGVGAHIFTAGGLLNLSYALGQEVGNAPALKGAKVHIGFSALF
ncbi:MAG TPA: hypothetical protein VFC87_06375 [Perlabentimonas sp.]|nr:hypothetical protein [Bacteroidales bacterium]HZJ74413.1 hypothetical protein [Perlabentimonas sp.]